MAQLKVYICIACGSFPSKSIFYFRTYTAPGDYVSFNETVSFQPSSSTSPLCVDIVINNDIILENDETFAVSLSSNDQDVIVESQNATVTISDDDGMYEHIGYDI